MTSRAEEPPFEDSLAEDTPAVGEEEVVALSLFDVTELPEEVGEAGACCPNCAA